jgi:hypothetical protein
MELGHAVKSCDDARGRVSSEILKVMNHVHLVMVVQLMRNLSPRAIGGSQLAVERSTESYDPRIELGRDSDLLEKSPFELPWCQIGTRCHFCDSDKTVVLKQPVGGCANRVQFAGVPQPVEKVSFDKLKPFFETATICQALLDNPEILSNHGRCIVGCVSKLRHRNAEKVMESSGLKMDGKRVDVSRD